MIGLTGAFVVLLNDDEGYMTAGLGGIKIGGKKITSTGKMKSSARRLRAKLGSLAALAEVESIVCCTRATLGAPKKVKGVWVARPADAVKIMARRANVLERSSAKRVAQSLGAKVPSQRRPSDGD